MNNDESTNSNTEATSENESLQQTDQTQMREQAKTVNLKSSSSNVSSDINKRLSLNECDIKKNSEGDLINEINKHEGKLIFIYNLINYLYSYFT